jgi:DNA-binding GntR family transcriptional regulator
MEAKGITHAIGLLRNESLSRLVEREVERMILAGELSPGERLNEGVLAQRLQVSRGPVREALRGIERSGLVTSVVNRGVFVREVSLAEALEAYEVRSALLSMVGRKLAREAERKLIDHLEALWQSMSAAVQADDLAAYYPLNVAFHRSLVEGARNRRLLAIYESLVNELHLFRRRSLVEQGRMRESNAEHRAILDAIRGRDPDLAATLLERHVSRGRERLLEALGGGNEEEAARDKASVTPAS